ncbi:ketopantoate reductase family protein [Clostridium magnum]|uniref:2-dehydropantoate 2-reductase n=1 Tax=Clostridium magnum DSM 2767 TaxID=1121326 RepID=A0A162RBZ0_9CLOT|nr:ketopantoate reductase C-terminal domain-containing protein [Clostridium magnum]KZL89689.1 2-dehydropantoate 2-reductase [Clostridium magnum DSM 2767]SHH76474.1 Ketopantoate reductase PanE/ApbA [Clostridium magnum DSM 2767]
MKIAIAGSGALGCRFGSMLHEAGNEVLLIDNWKEHVRNIQTKGLEIVTEAGSPIIHIGKYSGIEEVMKGIVNEIVEVAAAEKIELDNDKIMEMLQQLFDPAKTGNHLPSMLQDMQNGRKTEIEYLNGAIVKIAEKHNIAVPNNSLISHLISMMEKTRSLKCS